MFVINKLVAKTEDHVFFINPTVKDTYGSQRNKEGCLSFPGVFLDINRPERITISATNLAGEQFEITAEGYYAVAIAHEYEHLEGKLLVDHAPLVRRELIRRKSKKFKGKFFDYRGVLPCSKPNEESAQP